MPKPPARKDPLKSIDQEVMRQIQVKALIAAGTPKPTIAEYLGITPQMLRQQYPEELKSGANWMKARIELTVARQALNGDVRCALAWLKQYAGWTEVTRRELTGKDGEPISFRSLDGPSLDQVVKALRSAANAGRGGGRDIAPSIDIGSESIRDLEPISGTADEGTEE